MADSMLKIVLQLKDEASAKLKEVSKGMSAVGVDTKALNLATLGTAAAYTAVAAAMYKFGKAAISAADQYEQSTIAFETMMGSAVEAQAMLGQLAEFAKKTPFDLVGIEASAKQLMAMGIGANQILPSLKMLGDVSAGLNVPLSRLALNFGQVATQGKLTGRELRDFAVLGVPLIEQLSQQLGVSKVRIQEMVSEGEIGFAEVEKAFKNMTSEGGKFEDLMLKQSKTLSGSMENLKDTWQLFLRDAGKPFLEVAKEVIRALTWLAEKVLPYVALGIKGIAFIFEAAASKAERLFLILARGWAIIRGDTEDINIYNSALEQNSEEIGKLIDKYTESIPVIEKFGEAVGEVMAEVGEITKKQIDSMIGGLNRLADRLWGVADEETAALQELISIREEQVALLARELATIAGEQPPGVMEQVVRYGEDIAKAKERLEEITLGKKVRTTESIIDWAAGVKGAVEEKIGGLGLTAPEIMYPRLEPITTTPEQAVKNFNFNFTDTFIGDPEEFEKRIIDLINRDSELEELDG